MEPCVEAKRVQIFAILLESSNPSSIQIHENERFAAHLFFDEVNNLPGIQTLLYGVTVSSVRLDNVLRIFNVFLNDQEECRNSFRETNIKSIHLIRNTSYTNNHMQIIYGLLADM